MTRWLVCAALVAACGGGAQKVEAPVPAAAAPSGADPEAYAAVAEVFGKKKPQVSQCYANAIENRELADSAKGRVKLALTVLPSGQAQNVRVAETTLNSKAVEDCVVAMVQKWPLPAPAQPLDFLFTYEFSNQ